MAYERRSFSATAPETTLSGDISATSGTIGVVDGTGYPTGPEPFYIILSPGTASEEQVLVQSRSGNAMTVAAGGRGADSTAAYTHTSGAIVRHGLVARDADEANRHISDDTLDNHDQYMRTDGTRHDLTARHNVGTVVPVGTPLASAPGNAASTGASGTAADAKHVHARETVAELQNLIIPAGTSWETYSSTVPYGWLLEDGAAVSRATYPALFTAIGTTYGTGDGSTTFNVPDSRGRVLVGAGTGATPTLTNRVLGSEGGEEDHALTLGELATHTHTASSGSTGAHTHTLSTTSGGQSAAHTHTEGSVHSIDGGDTGARIVITKTPPQTNYLVNGSAANLGQSVTFSSVDNHAASTGVGSVDHAHGVSGTTSSDGSHSHTVTVNNSGSGTAHNNMQPYVVATRMIKAH